MEKEKGCSTAYLDSSPTVITAFTELGGAEPLVEVLKGCEELSCSQYSALNNSTHPNTILYGGISSNHWNPIKDWTNFQLLTSVWLEHTRRSQVQAWPSFVSSAISIGSVIWHLSYWHNCTVRCRQDCFGCKSTCMNTCWWIQRYWTHTCIEWVEEPASWACTYW